MGHRSYTTVIENQQEQRKISNIIMDKLVSGSDQWKLEDPEGIGSSLL